MQSHCTLRVRLPLCQPVCLLPAALQASLKERYDATKGATSKTYDDWSKQARLLLIFGLAMQGLSCSLVPPCVLMPQRRHACAV